MPNQKWNASLYDARHAFISEYGVGLVTLLNPLSGERILDVGCGTGALAQEIAQTGANVVGIDSSPEMIQSARAQYPGLEFDVQDASDFAFAVPFDAVFSNAALHWVRQAEETAACISRVLKPGGRFVAELGGQGNVATITAALQQAIYETVRIRTHHQWYFPSVPQYAAVLERNKLETTAVWLFDRPTKLIGTEGLRNWCLMFGSSMLGHVSDGDQDRVLARTEELCRPHIFRDNIWFADYRRLRVVAHKL